MKMVFQALFLTLFVTSATSAADLKDVAFIAGHWRGESPGIVIEEVWLPAQGEAMYSLFRMVRDGKTQFTELQAIEQRGKEIVLLLRHFNPGLIAREDKEAPLVWRLETFERNRAVFHQQGADTRLEYRLEKTGKLTVTLIKEHEGKTVRTPFQYQRVGAK